MSCHHRRSRLAPLPRGRRCRRRSRRGRRLRRRPRAAAPSPTSSSHRRLCRAGPDALWAAGAQSAADQLLHQSPRHPPPPPPPVHSPSPSAAVVAAHAATAGWSSTEQTRAAPASAARGCSPSSPSSHRCSIWVRCPHSRLRPRPHLPLLLPLMASSFSLFLCCQAAR